MNEKDKEYEEYFKIFEQKSTRQARQNTVTPRPTAQNRMPPRPGQQIPRKRQSPRKRRQKKRRIAIISSLAAILLIACIVLICKSCTGKRYHFSPYYLVWNEDHSLKRFGYLKTSSDGICEAGMDLPTSLTLMTTLKLPRLR